MTDQDRRLSDTRWTWLAPDRLHYATGMLLDVDDFGDEQDYHRGRLARLAAALGGPGTLCGLRVAYAAPEPATGDSPARPAKIEVRPGLALDPIGRLIEVPRPWCLAIDAWWDGHEAEPLLLARHAADPDRGIGIEGVVADVHARFAVCPREHTPVFRNDPFTGPDATTTARLRDHFEMTLDLVTDPDELAAGRHWSRIDLGAAPAPERALQDALLDAWSHRGELQATDLPIDGRVHLARIAWPLTADAEPTRDPDVEPAIDNHLRDFVLPIPALVRLIRSL